MRNCCGNGFWKSFGASVIGPGHVRAGLPNQDCFAAVRSPRYSVAVVSDGVGSCRHADVGSSAVCAAVMATAASFCVQAHGWWQVSKFLDEVKARYLSAVADLGARNCAATCIFALVYDEEVILAMLGDGLAALERFDGRRTFWTDDKSGAFSNVVSPLSERTLATNWKMQRFPASLCRAVLLCTDGVSDDLRSTDKFIEWYVESCAPMSDIEASSDTRDMLINWKTPCHTDDKTIVCMMQGGDKNA